MARGAREKTSQRAHEAAWPDVLANLQTAYAELTQARFQLERRAAEIEEARDLFQLLIESMSEALFLIDRSGRVIRANPAARALLECGPGALEGRSFAEVSGTPAIPATAWAVLERSPSGTLTNLEVEVRARSGRAIPVSVSCQLVRDAHGKIVGTLVVARDITERKRAEQALAFLAEASAVLGSSLDYEETFRAVARLAVPRIADWCIVHMIDQDGGLRYVAVAHPDRDRYVLIDEFYRRRFPDYDDPHPIASVLQTGEAQLVPDCDPEDWHSMASSPEHLDLIRTLAPRSAMIVPLLTGERMLGLVSFIYSDSGRRYSADDLALARDLAQRAAVAIDNARLYREVQAAVRLREEFLSIASHELKTPLTIVKTTTQLLTRRLRPSVAEGEQVASLLDRLHDGIDRLEKLVADLLDATWIQRGRLELHLEPVDLGTLARRVIERFEHAPERTERHILSLEVDGPVIGFWDPDRLDQVLTNLVSNALKYSPNGGEIRVCVRRFDSHADVMVSDQGIGIPADVQASLFQPFVRGQASRRGIGGTGLGLYIARQIVERHGGTISLESTPGVGTCITAVLPVQPPDLTQAGTPRG